MLSLSEKAVSQLGVFCNISMSAQELAVMMRSFEAWRETARIETTVLLGRVMPIPEMAAGACIAAIA